MAKAPIRVGTCSWADESFVKVYYPPGVRSGEERLRYYAERFDVVEANSTFYRLPEEDMVAAWARRTPDDFTMHVKAFGLMTKHEVLAQALPPDLRETMPVDERGRVSRPSRDLRAEVFRRFTAALEPLRSSGKLGGILLQFPPYVVPKPSSYDYIEWAHEQLRGYELLVEFRHRSWFDRAADTLAFLEARGLTYVTPDAPPSAIPLVVGRTTGTAYVRLHGRNARTWYKRTGSAAERFDYLYSEEELAEWATTLRELAGHADVVYAMFNNNGRSPARAAPADIVGETGREEIAQAPTNAAMLKQLLASAA